MRSSRTREQLDRYTLELQQHGLESVEREVRWLNELIATERDASSHAARRSTPRTEEPSMNVHTTPASPPAKENTAMGSVRVAIVGVGNCAASLVQGVEYYKDADPSARVPGLMHVQLGDYHVSDIEFVAAFDVDGKKVGRDLSEAIVASENNTIKICRRAADRHHRAARSHSRRPRQVLPRDHRGVRRAAGRRRRRR